MSPAPATSNTYCDQNGHNFIVVEHDGLVNPTDSNTFTVLIICTRCGEFRRIDTR